MKSFKLIAIALLLSASSVLVKADTRQEMARYAEEHLVKWINCRVGINDGLEKSFKDMINKLQAPVDPAESEHLMPDGRTSCAEYNAMHAAERSIRTYRNWLDAARKVSIRTEMAPYADVKRHCTDKMIYLWSESQHYKNVIEEDPSKKNHPYYTFSAAEQKIMEKPAFQKCAGALQSINSDREVYALAVHNDNVCKNMLEALHKRGQQSYAKQDN